MGQPNTAKAVLHMTEYIGHGELTRRSETSQYPEEQKSIEISQVAASEREKA